MATIGPVAIFGAYALIFVNIFLIYPKRFGIIVTVFVVELSLMSSIPLVIRTYTATVENLKKKVVCSAYCEYLLLVHIAAAGIKVPNHLES